MKYALRMRNFRVVPAIVIAALGSILIGQGCGDIDPSGLLVVGADASDVVVPPESGALACINGVKDGDETGIDCGGAVCMKRCAPKDPCKVASDCDSSVCTAGFCASPTCSDGAKNGMETDVDCGGTCTTKCATSQSCASAADCASAVCTGGKCAAPSCTDMQ